MNRMLLSRKKPTAAFSLVEVTLALGIAAFTLLAVFGLMPIGMNAARFSTEQTMASDLATQLVADLTQTPGTEAQSERFGIPFPTGTAVVSSTLYFTDGQTASTSPGVSSRYRAVISLKRLDTTKTATVGAVSITWPALPGTNQPLGAFRVPVGIDRNFQ